MKIGPRKPLALKAATASGAGKRRLKCTYVKSPHLRVVEVDGVYGGITPQGLIEMTLFSERFPTPSEVDYDITPDGKMGDEIKGSRVAPVGFERELEVRAMIRPATAKAIIAWLQNGLEKLGHIREQKDKK